MATMAVKKARKIETVMTYDQWRKEVKRRKRTRRIKRLRKICRKVNRVLSIQMSLLEAVALGGLMSFAVYILCRL